MTTLTRFLIEERRRHPEATGELNSLLLSVAVACKSIAAQAGQGTLTAAAGEPQRRLEAIAAQAFVRSIEWGGHAVALLSDEMQQPYVPAQGAEGRYLLAFKALDGACESDLNAPMGSVFSILRAPSGIPASNAAAFMQPGSAQVAAGYAIHGPATMLVLTVGRGTHGFTLDRSIGEFYLSHRDIRVPEYASGLAIDSAGHRFWPAPVRRYVAECVAGGAGPRSRDFDMRWNACLVAEAHRILLRGGVYLQPREEPVLRAGAGAALLHEANPVGFLVEQAGGRASTGRGALLAAQPTTLEHRASLFLGSSAEVERIERYHAEDVERPGIDLPLFKSRGLFRESLAA